MFKLMLKRIKSNFIHYFLIFIGYVAALLIISFAFTFLKCSKDMNIDYTNGKIEHQRLISINIDDYNNLNKAPYDKIITILKKYSKTTSIRIDGIISDKETDGKIFEIPIQSIIFNQTPEWIPKISDGRYFNSQESSSKDKIAVIGKGVQLNELSHNNKIDLGGEKFNIIGVAGKMNNFSNYLGTTFIPFEALPNKLKENIKTFQIYLFKNNDNPKNEMNEIISELNKLPNISANEAEINENLSQFYSSLSITLFVSFLIILLCVSNLVILIFYLMLKNKMNILISIALGANIKIIWKQIFTELMFIALCSIIFTLISANLLIPFVKNNFTNILNIENLNFNYLNVLITFLISIIISFFISLISVKKFFKLNLITELKGD